jgi:hypothetical protein
MGTRQFQKTGPHCVLQQLTRATFRLLHHFPACQGELSFCVGTGQFSFFMGKGKNMSNYTCWSMEVSTVHKSQILLCRKVCKSGWVLLNIGAIKGAGWKAGRPSIHPPAAWSSAATWPNPGRAAHDLGDVAARLCGLNPRDAAETFSGTDAGLSNSSLAHSAGLVNDPSVARWTLVLSAIQLGGHAWGCGSNKQIPIDRPSDRRGT